MDWLWSALSDDNTTATVGRVILMMSMFALAVFMQMLYRRSGDNNPAPWAYATIVWTAYGAMLAATILAGKSVVSGYLRHTWTTLNGSGTVATAWIAWRLYKLYQDAVTAATIRAIADRGDGS